MNEFLQTVETGLKPVFTWNMIRNMQFLFYGMFLMFVFYSCASAPTRIPNKLDLSEERKLVEEAKEISREQKAVILQAFDKADSVNESVRVYARQLEEQNAQLKKDKIKVSDIATYNDDANAALFDTPVVGAEVYISEDNGGKHFQPKRSNTKSSKPCSLNLRGIW